MIECRGASGERGIGGRFGGLIFGTQGWEELQCAVAVAGIYYVEYITSHRDSRTMSQCYQNNGCDLGTG